jgi:hypothetical protein
MDENFIGGITDKLRAKLGKLIAGKISEAEFQDIVRAAVRRELCELRAKVNKNITGKDREKNAIQTR